LKLKGEVTQGTFKNLGKGRNRFPHLLSFFWLPLVLAKFMPKDKMSLEKSFWKGELRNLGHCAPVGIQGKKRIVSN
jgi:hypothetical protein